MAVWEVAVQDGQGPAWGRLRPPSSSLGCSSFSLGINLKKDVASPRLAQLREEAGDLVRVGKRCPHRLPKPLAPCCDSHRLPAERSVLCSGKSISECLRSMRRRAFLRTCARVCMCVCVVLSFNCLKAYDQTIYNFVLMVYSLL